MDGLIEALKAAGVPSGVSDHERVPGSGNAVRSHIRKVIAADRDAVLRVLARAYYDEWQVKAERLNTLRPGEARSDDRSMCIMRARERRDAAAGLLQAMTEGIEWRGIVVSESAFDSLLAPEAPRV